MVVLEWIPVKKVAKSAILNLKATALGVIVIAKVVLITKPSALLVTQFTIFPEQNVYYFVNLELIQMKIEFAIYAHKIAFYAAQLSFASNVLYHFTCNPELATDVH